ncbi:hypothetical protein I8751_06610 [Nostocaceae cyanobacterium CENA357]|uniref:Uncharacterized protein n=1 Tax=Atlanticothrix silvestris CENA357 TaxID=1725252 RepID=A0A8J7HGT2_9CYAN|nr:hypothetical protein [Atlanticothrix silvestris CENA357]
MRPTIRFHNGRVDQFAILTNRLRSIQCGKAGSYLAPSNKINNLCL